MIAAECQQDVASILFKVGTFACCAIFSFYFVVSFEVYHQMQADFGTHHHLTDLPVFSEVFWVPLASAFAHGCLKMQLINLSVPFIRTVAKDQGDTRKVEMRAQRGGFALYKFVFYLLSVVIGYWILRDSDMLPWYLGGSGHFSNIWSGIPYQKQDDYLLIHSLIQMGYFIEDTVYLLLFKEESSDFWEMCLHHLLTLSLIGGMISQNLLRGGYMTLWLHCIADIFTAFSRFLSQTQYKTATAVCFVVATLVWHYTRNFCLLQVTWHCWYELVYPAELARFQAAPSILVYFLMGLCVMHVYWVILFWNMILNGVKSGDTDDKQRRVNFETEEHVKVAKVE